jgi:serine/threonine protein phosphatase PrpC
MGSFLDKPKTEKTNEQGHGNNIRYGLAAMQGWRVEMEDSHSSLASLPMPGLENWSFFAVFDGHAGGTVSKHSSKELLQSILDADVELFKELANIYSSSSSSSQINQNNKNKSSPASSPRSSRSSISPTKSNASPNTNDAKNPLNNNTTSSNSKLENSNSTSDSNHVNNTTTSNKLNNLNSSPSNSNTSLNNGASVSVTPNGYSITIEKRLEKAIRQGFLNLDEHLRNMPELNRGEDKSGSTAVACLISPSHVYLINCGDSRAIFCSDNQVVSSTVDHKPINQNERERIQNAGGSVMIQRVNGSLAVSRALGDYEYKSVEGRGPCEQLVSPEPEIYVRERSLEKDEFVCLACDGIWDVMTNENLKEYIHSRLKVTDDLIKISNDVLDMCLNKVKLDFLSFIGIFLFESEFLHYPSI